MTVTLEQLEASGLRQEVHYTGAGFFGHIYRCIKFPRLQRNDKCIRKTRSVESTFLVDGAPVESLEAAIEKLNSPPVVTDAEREWLKHFTDEFADLRQAVPHEVLYGLTNKGLIEAGAGKHRLRKEPA